MAQEQAAQRLVQDIGRQADAALTRFRPSSSLGLRLPSAGPPGSPGGKGPRGGWFIVSSEWCANTTASSRLRVGLRQLRVEPLELLLVDVAAVAAGLGDRVQHDEPEPRPGRKSSCPSRRDVLLGEAVADRRPVRDEVLLDVLALPQRPARGSGGTSVEPALSSSGVARYCACPRAIRAPSSRRPEAAHAEGLRPTRWPWALTLDAADGQRLEAELRGWLPWIRASWFPKIPYHGIARPTERNGLFALEQAREVAHRALRCASSQFSSSSGE